MYEFFSCIRQNIEDKRVSYFNPITHLEEEEEEEEQENWLML
jgi:hypothetical protein